MRNCVPDVKLGIFRMPVCLELARSSDNNTEGPSATDDSLDLDSLRSFHSHDLP